MRPYKSQKINSSVLTAINGRNPVHLAYYGGGGGGVTRGGSPQMAGSGGSGGNNFQPQKIHCLRSNGGNGGEMVREDFASKHNGVGDCHFAMCGTDTTRRYMDDVKLQVVVTW
jgi:hypothetical protein